MTLHISSVFTYDEDAGNYIQAVEAADGQVLEGATRKAINNFVIGCKADGIWSAIKASCILAGARTLSGALVPLAGTAPTNFNFVSGDYNRKTGLVGNGSTKYLNSNRNNNTDPQNSQHFSIFLNTTTNTNVSHMGAGGGAAGASVLAVSSTVSTSFHRSRNSAGFAVGVLAPGFYGISRPTATGYFVRASSATANVSVASQAPYSGDIFLFARNDSGLANQHISDRLAFYSIGESLNLALLDARVTDLITAFGAAIP